ncbi:MAG: ABC transporter permease [Candidatus Tectomicrobia bacterium]|nr:ABC transporter permease [Candidatus Tectomicrobia bacterium]
MLPLVLRRCLSIVPTLFVVSVLMFLLARLAPGDPAVLLLGERATPEAVAALRRDLGLDDPLLAQYGRYALKVLRGDFGLSLRTRAPVGEELWERFPATLELALVSMLWATAVGMLAGVLAALRRGGWFDLLSRAAAVTGVSMPVYWLGLLLLLIFSVWLGWLPLSGRLSIGLEAPRVSGLLLVDTLLAGDRGAFLDALRHLILPALALGSIPVALVARMTRASVLDVLHQDYVRTARAKGLPPRRVVGKHVLKNALIAITTVVGLQFGLLLSGAILTETIFSWPGMGRWLIQAVYERDFQVLQCGALVVATAFVLINLLVDLSYLAVDPRLRQRS